MEPDRGGDLESNDIPQSTICEKTRDDEENTKPGPRPDYIDRPLFCKPLVE